MKLRLSARWLFGSAGVFNLAVAGGLLFLREPLTPLLGLAPVAGSNRVFLGLAAALIACFGVAYLLVASDAQRYRPYIGLGIAGKLLAILAVLVPWTLDEIGPSLPLLVSVDGVYAVLFGIFLHRAAGAAR